MNCVHCVFFERLKANPNNPPCITCSPEPCDKGYCVAIMSREGYVPVITRIAEESRARELLRRGSNNGGNFQLLRWSTERCAYLFA